MYLIIYCPSCAKIILANSTNRIKTCPYCGVKVTIITSKILAKSESAQEALEIIQSLKQKENDDPHPITFKKFKDRASKSF